MVVGDLGTVLYFENNQWRKIDVDHSADLKVVNGCSRDDIWIGSNTSVINIRGKNLGNWKNTGGRAAVDILCDPQRNAVATRFASGLTQFVGETTENIDLAGDALFLLAHNDDGLWTNEFEKGLVYRIDAANKATLIPLDRNDQVHSIHGSGRPTSLDRGNKPPRKRTARGLSYKTRRRDAHNDLS